MTEIDENKKDDLNRALEDIQKRVIHVKCRNQLSDSIVNYFTMAIGFYMFGCIKAQIFKNENDKFLYWNIMVAGIAQIALGVYDWYKGKSLYILINFSYGLLFISWFMKNKLTEDQSIHINEDEEYEGALYIIWFILTIIIVFGLKNKGIIYIIDFLILAIGFIFLFLDKYIDKNWSKKTYGIIFIVSGGLFWLTGVLRIFNHFYLENKLSFVKE